MSNLRLTRRQVRAVDRWAIEQLGMSGLVLMENAGRQVADAAVAMLGPTAGAKVAIVAGAGNNGGDGFVVARHLALRGVAAITFLVADEDKLTLDAAGNLNILRQLNCAVEGVEPSQLGALAQRLAGFDLIVDAIGGTGISGPLRAETAAAVQAVNDARRPVVAVDIPTGLDCDTGDAPGPVVRADVTVTFVAAKVGFDLPQAKAFLGRVIVADIGVAPPDSLGAQVQ